MRTILLFLMVAFTTTATFSQDLKTPPIKRCGSFEVYQQMLQSDLKFAKNQEAIEQFTRNYITRGGSANMKTSVGTPVYVIPVIVHVLYKTAAQNISNAQIQSQIDVLNKDFQKLNTDLNKVPSVWTGLVADCKIQFCLATIDPNGNPTTGIRRVQTTKGSFNTNNNVKFTSKGGDNAWPAADYLNLWVCNLGFGLLGYAQFPGGAAATDGVVIDFTAFGTTGKAKAPFNLGRTATHEVGHWLNLRHIWGDDGNQCNGTDQVGDTPNQGNENYGCPTFPTVSCSNGPNGDMFVNYMDYTDDRCMFMFTNGQKNRIYATLVEGGAHYSVTLSGKCGSQTVAKNNSALIPALINIVPNPVTSGAVTASYKLEKAAQVQLMISDVYGNNMHVINAGSQSMGEHQVRPSEFGRLGNGVYIIKLIANGQQIGSTRFVVNK